MSHDNRNSVCETTLEVDGVIADAIWSHGTIAITTFGGNSMPDPRRLKVGDKIRFIGIPDEWASPNYIVPRESRRFMKHMLMRKFPSRIFEIDAYGNPRIAVRFSIGGKIEHHTWTITEHTGWRKVKKRT